MGWLMANAGLRDYVFSLRAREIYESWFIELQISSDGKTSFIKTIKQTPLALQKIENPRLRYAHNGCGPAKFDGILRDPILEDHSPPLHYNVPQHRCKVSLGRKYKITQNCLTYLLDYMFIIKYQKTDLKPD